MRRHAILDPGGIDEYTVGYALPKSTPIEPYRILILLTCGYLWMVFAQFTQWPWRGRSRSLSRHSSVVPCA